MKIKSPTELSKEIEKIHNELFMHTFTSNHINENDTITLETLQNIKEEYQIGKHPLYDFAKERGFNYEDGDQIIFPDNGMFTQEEKLKLLQMKDVYFSCMVVDVLFIKSPLNHKLEFDWNKTILYRDCVTNTKDVS